MFIVLGALYGATIFICFNNCGTVQPVVSIERTVFYREKAAGMYSAIPYALAQASSLVSIIMIFRALFVPNVDLPRISVTTVGRLRV